MTTLAIELPPGATLQETDAAAQAATRILRARPEVVSIYASVVQVYLRTILYRFATGQSVPDLGVDLAAAFPAASL